MRKFISLTAVLCVISAIFATSSHAAEYYNDGFDYPSYSVMSTVWKVTKGGTADIAELRDNTVYLAPGSSTGLAQIVRAYTLADKEIAVEFDLRLENQNTTYAAGVQIFDGESRNFVFISPTVFRTNDNKINKSILTDDSWYTYRTEMSKDGVSWYRKPQGSEDSEYVEIVRNADSKQSNTTAPNIKFFVERTTEQGAYIDNVKLMPLDDTVDLGRYSFIMDSMTEFQTSDFAFTAASPGKVSGSGSGRSISLKANGSEGVQQAVKNVSASDRYIYEMICTLNNLSDNRSLGIELSAGLGQGRARIYLYTNKVAFGTETGALTAVDYDMGNDEHIIRLEAEKTASGWQYDVYIDGLCFAQNCSTEVFGAENAYLKLFVEKDAAADVSVRDITLVSGRIGADNRIEEYFFAANKDLEKYGWRISGSAESGSGAIEFQAAGGSAEKYIHANSTQLETRFEMLCSGGEGKVSISNAAGTVTVYEGGSSLLVNGQQVETVEEGVWNRYRIIQSAEKYKVYKKTGIGGYELIDEGTAADAQPAGVIIRGADVSVRNLKCTQSADEYAYDAVNRRISSKAYKDADDSITVIPAEGFDAAAVQFDYTHCGSDLKAAVENTEYKAEITIKAEEIIYGTADGILSAKIGSAENESYTVRLFADLSAGTYSMYRREYGSSTENVIFENASMPSAGEAFRLTASPELDNLYAVFMSELAAPEYFYSGGSYSDEYAALAGWRVEENSFGEGLQMVMGETVKTASAYFTPPVDTYTAEFDVTLKYTQADENDNIFEVLSGKNLACLSFLPDRLGVGTANGEMLYDIAHESGKSYTYRIEQSGKWANIVRYDGDSTEVIVSGIQLPQNSGRAEVRITAACGGVDAEFKNIRISGMLPRKMTDSGKSTGLGIHFTDSFENEEFGATGWRAHTENITIKDGRASFEANGVTTAQLLTRPMETIDALVYRMKYRLDERNTRLGFMLLDTEKRVFISIGGSDIFMRDGEETIHRLPVQSETGVWYELRLETTEDGFYSIYRKNADGEWICLADMVQMQPWTKETQTYAKYFIENNAAAAASLDCVEYFTGAAVTDAALEVSDTEAKATWRIETAGSLLRPEKNNLILQGILGLYSETQLEAAAAGSIDTENVSLSGLLTEATAKVKAMLWDGLNTMKPAAAEEINISEEAVK